MANSAQPPVAQAGSFQLSETDAAVLGGDQDFYTKVAASALARAMITSSRI